MSVTLAGSLFLDTPTLEPPPSLILRCDRISHRVLTAGIAAALQCAGPVSSYESQFRLRTSARRIAQDAFGPSTLTAARSHLKRGGLILYANLPTTEEDAGDPGSDRLTRGQALAAVLCQATTGSIAYSQEDAGRHFQRLYPVPGVVNGGRTPETLLPHLDNPFLVPCAQAQAIHLYCVNNDAQASTKFISMPAVIRGLAEGYGQAAVSLLTHPAYVSAVSNSFVSPGLPRITTRPRPVLTGPNRGHPSRFLAKAFDIAVAPAIENRDRYEWALQAYINVVTERDDLAFHITASPGMGLSFNQVTMLHGRGSILAGRYREMVRAYGRFGFTRLITRLGHIPPHYVFDASQLIDV